MDGVLVIDKPEGFTSFDVVAIVRKLCHEKKVGHTGTLDPIATGVLVVLLGKATKAQAFMEESFKKYEAGFKLGISTDTQDITGKIIKQADVCIRKKDIENSLKNYVGNLKQIPPMFSAIKKDGVKLYDLARKGIEVERQERDIVIHEIELLEYNDKLCEGKIRVKCSKGTYVRTLCHDIGEALGCGGVMTSLRRTYTDGFSILDSKALDAIKRLSEHEIQNEVLKTDTLFKNLKSIYVSEAQKVRFLNGGSLMVSRVSLKEKVSGKVKVYFKNEFLGLGEINLDKNEVSVLKILNRIENDGNI